WSRGAYVRIGLSVKATEAALERSGSGFCGYGEGWDAYGKCYVAGLADGNVSSFLGDYVFASLIHQDPRYFRRGEGAAPARIGYAVSRVFIGRMDSGATALRGDDERSYRGAKRIGCYRLLLSTVCSGKLMARRTARFLLDTCGDEAYDAYVYAIEALDPKTRTH